MEHSEKSPEEVPKNTPRNMAGRGKNSKNYKKFKWNITMYDKESCTMKSGKFSTIKDLNQEMNLQLNVDICQRLLTGKRVDKTKKHKDNSFLAKYGHIKLEKIDEYREGFNRLTPRSLKDTLLNNNV